MENGLIGSMELAENEGAERPDAIELDVTIATGMAAKMMSSQEAVDALTNAFSGPNFVRTVAMFLAQLVEKIQEGSESTAPLDPSIWFMDGGVLDELGDEISDIAESAGVPFTQQTMSQIKTEVLNIGKQRASQEAPEQDVEQPPQNGLIGGA